MREQVLGPIWARRYAVTVTAPRGWPRPCVRGPGLRDLAALLLVPRIARAARLGLGDRPLGEAVCLAALFGGGAHR